MSDTLEALHRAVIASPQDRTVRLVYADALDETGEPVHVARAEFIRSQIERESLPESDDRHAALGLRCGELFDEHWLAWWEPVAEAAKLPYRHVPRKRVRDRVARAAGRRPRRPANWPYAHTTADPAVELPDYGLSFRFAGGFPEEVLFRNFDVPEGGPVLVHRWGDALPLVRLSFAPFVDAAHWDRIDGPHLARLTDLALERLQDDTAAALARSPHLTSVTRLAVNPAGGDDASVVRHLCELSPEAGPRALRVLHFTGRLSPAAVAAFATDCRFEKLEELDLSLGNPGLLGGLGLAGNPMAEAANLLAQMIGQLVAFPGIGATRWAEYGPALEVLAGARWVRRLRRLRILSGHASGLLGFVSAQLYTSGPQADEPNLLPDAAVLALAAALGPDKLERLVLPAVVVGPAAREQLTARLGTRVLFA